MKTLTLVTIASLTTLMAGAAIAQPGPQGPRPGGAMLLKAADVNADNVVTRAEFEGLQRETFDWMDRNGDDILNVQDRSPVTQRLHAQRDGDGSDWGRLARRQGPAQAIDANDDRQISWTEFQAHSAERFEKVDANADGQITLEEAEAARPERRGLRGRMGPRRG